MSAVQKTAAYYFRNIFGIFSPNSEESNEDVAQNFAAVSTVVGLFHSVNM